MASGNSYRDTLQMKEFRLILFVDLSRNAKDHGINSLTASTALNRQRIVSDQ